MKKIFTYPGRLALLSAAVYLVGLLVGLCALSAPFLSREKSMLLHDANIVAQSCRANEYENFRSLERPSVTHIFFFDKTGACINYESRVENTSDEFLGYFDPFLSKVLDGEELFQITRSYFSRRLTHLWLVAGVPVENQGTVGAVFIINNLTHLQEMLLVFVVYFSIFYGLFLYFFISTIRKQIRLDHMQRNYVDNVTHALKAPLASIKALTETLSEKMDCDPLQRSIYYGMILQEVNAQSCMVQELLTLSKLQKADTDFSTTSVKAASVFAALRQKYAPLCDCMGITLTMTEEAINLPPLNTNEACFTQLLDVLLNNALKFVNEDGKIIIHATASKRQATICVRDNGVGIAEQDLPYIFDRFFKSGGKRNESGSGLGLAIAKEIVNGLKEKIWVESEAGSGSAFFFTVKLK